MPQVMRCADCGTVDGDTVRLRDDGVVRCEECDSEDAGAELITSACGATSSRLDEAWNLIPFAALRAMARRFWFGSQKHAPRNWERGDDAFAELRLSHCMRHLALFVEFRRQEDLDAVLCNSAMLAYFKAKGFLQERKGN